jgi:hypothetical protein
MFLLQYLEEGKTLKFPNNKTTKKHFRSLSDYYNDMGVDV